jgi:hypothetical protein
MQTLNPNIEIEEPIYTYTDANSSIVNFSQPETFPAIGPDAANKDSARHLNRELSVV